MKTLAVLGAIALLAGGYRIVKDVILAPAEPPRPWKIVTLERFESPLQVDINRAPADSLELVPGIGPVLSARIIGYREKHGDFAAIDSLLNVPGIGRDKLNRIRRYITIYR